MTLENELMTESEEESLQKEIAVHYGRVLRAGELNRDAREFLPKGARYRVYRMTMKKHRAEIHKIREDVLRDVYLAARLQSNDSKAQAFREFYLKEVTERCKELLDGNFYVRLNAVIILSELNLAEPIPQKNQPAVPYIPAAEPLLAVVKDDQQPPAVRIAAVGRSEPPTGLQKILWALHGPREIDLKHRIVHGLIDGLKNKDAHYWYQMRLVEALGATDLILDRTTREPFLFKAVSSVLVDQQRHWLVRSEAARVLGRLPANGEINFGLLAFEVVQLARQMSVAYNQTPNVIFWRECYFDLYLAFRPLNDQENARQAGFLLKAGTGPHQKTINDAYRQVLPFVKHVLNEPRGTKIADAMIAPVDAWLKENKPEDMRVAPNLEPISTKRQQSETAVATD